MKKKSKPKGYKRRKNGEGSFSARDNGKIQVSIMHNRERDYYSSYDMQECKDWLEQQRIKIYLGMSIKNGNVTYLDWVRKYADTYCAEFVRPSTFSNYMCYINKHIAADPIAKIKLSKLTTDDIQGFIKNLSINGRVDGSGGISPKTIRNICQFVKSSLAQAKNNGLIWNNPAEFVRLPKVNSKKRPLLTEEEVDRLINAADNQQMKLAITLLSITGARISELLALRHSSVIEVENVVCLNITHALKREHNFDAKPGEPKTVLRLSKPKTDSSVRKVPVLPSVINMLNEHINEQKRCSELYKGIYSDDPFIIGSDLGDKIDPGTFRDHFAKAVKKAGLPDSVTPHALRHFVASTLIRKGASPVAVAKILGHSQSSTTLNVYSSESLDGAFNALMKLNDNTIIKK